MRREFALILGTLAFFTSQHGVADNLKSDRIRVMISPGSNEPMIGDPDKLLTPDEQALLRVMHTSREDNIKFWMNRYGAKKSKEYSNRFYDDKGKPKSLGQLEKEGEVEVKREH